MTWTTDLPTEPGTYWVSLDPSLRVEGFTPIGSCWIAWSAKFNELHYHEDGASCSLARLLESAPELEQL